MTRRLAPAAEYVRHLNACPAIGGNGDADCTCGAVQFLGAIESTQQQLSDAVSSLSRLSPAQAPLKERLRLKIIEAHDAGRRAQAEGDHGGMNYHDGRADAYGGVLAMLEVSALSPHPPTSEEPSDIDTLRKRGLIYLRTLPEDEQKAMWRAIIDGSPHPPSEERADAAQGGVHIDKDGSMFYDNVPRVEESDQ